ncbi:hypothetical protein KNE206_30510 [Kitasatospora sp. NE20-6]|uniref:hypothetical protein n=1 Tax=Kitasatospora sp. NE20-6 TaxID=2859066 RepID=UPI0034DCC1EA
MRGQRRRRRAALLAVCLTAGFPAGVAAAAWLHRHRDTVNNPALLALFTIAAFSVMALCDRLWNGRRSRPGRSHRS